MSNEDINSQSGNVRNQHRHYRRCGNQRLHHFVHPIQLTGKAKAAVVQVYTRRFYESEFLVGRMTPAKVVNQANTILSEVNNISIAPHSSP
jgi:hypothetical protein